MPKLKTHSGAKKRFRVTGRGKVKFQPAHKRHLLMNKPKSMKRKARGMRTMFKTDGDNVLVHYMPYSLKKRKITRNKKAEGQTDKAAAMAKAGA